MTTSYTTGSITSCLVAVRCAHRPCMQSGQGRILFELSTDHEHITVTALARRETGFNAVQRCDLCRGWNGIKYSVRQAA